MDKRQHYIDGKWVTGNDNPDYSVIDPSNSEPFATISLGGEAETNAAVAAARAAFGNDVCRVSA